MKNSTKLGPEDGPYPLDKIKEAVVLKAFIGGFYEPLDTFFKEMRLEWGKSKTAHATKRGGIPYIVLGRKFFAEEVHNVSEAAEIVLHEILHHVFRHLDLMDILRAQGYTHDQMNVAMDAIINGFLGRVGCAEFMRRFYADENQWAFLRPGSVHFRRTDWIVAADNTQAGRLEDDDESGEDDDYLGGDDDDYDYDPVYDVKVLRYKPKIDAATFEDWREEASNFHDQLYELNTSLEQSLWFFKRWFGQMDDKKPLLGGHDKQPGQGKPDENDDADDCGGQPDSGEPILSKGVAEALLGIIKGVPVSKQCQNNFSSIIRQVTTFARAPGLHRQGTRYSRRIPAKLSRRDLINIERGKDLFTRPDFMIHEVTLFIDVSGSLTQYLPFIVGLMQSLKRSEFKVDAVCWADRAEPVTLSDLQAGELPEHLGIGTTGECVAAYIAEHKIKQAVVITDNAAGQIDTRIGARLQLCLIQGSSMTGSFLDRSKVPHCKVHQLKLG